MCATAYGSWRGNVHHQFGGQHLYPLRSYWPPSPINLFLISIINKIFDVNTEEMCLSSGKANEVDA